VQPIIHINDGLWANLATIAFLLALSAFAMWLDHRSHGEVSVFAWIFSALFVLFCYVPLDAIRKPKSRWLAIEGDDLVWRIRTKESEAVCEGRLPLRSLRTLEFVIPKEVLAPRSRLNSCAELFFITVHGSRHELPLDFLPGVYREKIVAAMQQHVPNVQIVERQ
jgi:hypothetical protein